MRCPVWQLCPVGNQQVQEQESEGMCPFLCLTPAPSTRDTRECRLKYGVGGGVVLMQRTFILSDTPWLEPWVEA